MENSMGVKLISIIQWYVIPAIIVYFFFFSVKICFLVNDQENKTSARSGILAGLVIFVAYFINQSKNSIFLIDQIKEFPNFQYLPFFIGIIVGIGLLFLLHIVFSTYFIGVITLIYTTISTVGLFTYFFLDNFRSPLLFFILGLALGNLLYSIVEPSVLNDFD